MNEFPIIRLSIERMQQTMLHAFNARQLEISAEVERALAIECSQEKIQEYVNIAAEAAVKSAVTDAVKRWWSTAPEGRALIEAAVAKRLNEEAASYRAASEF